MERHLAVILAADVVGYSRLMEVDEERTHAAFLTAKLLSRGGSKGTAAGFSQGQGSIDWPASNRNAGRNEIGTGGRLRFGINGRLHRNTHEERAMAAKGHLVRPNGVNTAKYVPVFPFIGNNFQAAQELADQINAFRDSSHSGEFHAGDAQAAIQKIKTTGEAAHFDVLPGSRSRFDHGDVALAPAKIAMETPRRGVEVCLARRHEQGNQ